MQSLDFSSHIKPLKQNKFMHALCHQGSCPNRQPASTVEWQIGCWVHFQQCEALIPLSVLFIFCLASSLSCAFEIFLLWRGLSFYLLKDKRVWNLKRWAYSCIYCSTQLIHLPSICYSFPPSSFPPVTHFTIYPIFITLPCSFPSSSSLQFQGDLLDSRGDLVCVTDSWARIH